MDKAKVVNHFSLNNIDLEELLRQQDTFFVNDDAVIIFNGSIQRSPIFHKEEIYQVAEPRIVLAMEGSGDVCINLQDYHIEKGWVMLSLKSMRFLPMPYSLLSCYAIVWKYPKKLYLSLLQQNTTDCYVCFIL